MSDPDAWGQRPDPPPAGGQVPPPPGQWTPPPPGQWTPPPGGQYPAPPPYGYAPARATNGMAIASMVLGIVWIYWIGSILALVFGYIAKRQIAERNESGAGMATAGIVLGWVGIGFLVLFIVIAIVAALGADNSTSFD